MIRLFIYTDAFFPILSPTHFVKFSLDDEQPGHKNTIKGWVRMSLRIAVCGFMLLLNVQAKASEDYMPSHPGLSLICQVPNFEADENELSDPEVADSALLQAKKNNQQKRVEIRRRMEQLYSQKRSRAQSPLPRNQFYEDMEKFDSSLDPNTDIIRPEAIHFDEKFAYDVCRFEQEKINLLSKSNPQDYGSFE